MGADPRIRMIALESEVSRVEAKVDALDTRLAEIERLLAAITRSNAGKDARHVRA